MRRITGLAMLVTEVALLWLTMGLAPFGIAILVLALAGCLAPLQFFWAARRWAVAMGMVAVGFYLLHQLGAFDRIPLRSEPVAEPESLAGALCFMSLQAMQFYRRNAGGLPQYFPLLGVVALSYSADQYLSGRDATLAFACAMLFGVFAALFYAAVIERHEAQRRRWLLRRCLLSLLCLLLSLGLAAGTAVALKEGDTVIAQWMANRALMQKLGLGNEPQSRLDSISELKSGDSERIVLQIEAATSPGYLRGQAYADYQNDTWHALLFGPSIRIADRMPDGHAPLWKDASLFEIPPPSGPVDGAMVVFPSPEIERALFTPLELAWVGKRGGLQVNEARVVQSPAVSYGQPYQVLTAPRFEDAPLAEAEREKYTRLPSRLAPRIRALSDLVCAGRTDNVSKAHAVVQHFTGNYDYTLGIEVPKDADPMEYFLFSEPPPAAHCEFFATGAALLLRAAGVPARYVTGVGVWEQHPFADYWVARNRDAHAWVEAWDPEAGWFIVEATPSDGLPEAGNARKTSSLRDLWSLVTLHLRQFMAALRDGAWRAAVDALAAMLVGLYQFVQDAWLPLVTALGLVMVLIRLMRRRKRRSVRHLPQCEIYRRLHRQLSVMDRTVKRGHQLERAAHETPHAFAATLEAAMPDAERAGALAAWYRSWAETRYQPTLNGAAVDRLEQSLRELKRRRKRNEDR